MHVRRLSTLVAMTLGLVALAVMPASAGNGNSTVIGDGPDLVASSVSPNPLAHAITQVSAANVGSGNLQVTLDVWDVNAPAGTTFGAHVHVTPCDPSLPGLGAGGHYSGPLTSGPFARHEIWLDFTVNAHGRGHAVATRQFSIGPSARSVIIHANPTNPDDGTAGGRLACTNVAF